MQISPEYVKKLRNKPWRMKNLYSVKNRHNKVVPYIRNEAQAHFAKNRWYFNIVLKARRLGFSTEIGISMLDDTLWNPYDNLLIAHTDDDAKKLFKDKIMNTWINLPEDLRNLFTIDQDRANMLRFDRGELEDPKTKRVTRNFSSVTVALSGRSGGFTKVHISEFGKICARFPDRADEIITGTIPTIPYGGQLDIESTAEGDQGYYHDMFWDAWNDPHNHLPPNEIKKYKKKNEFKAHFYNWQWDKEEINALVQNQPLPTDQMENGQYFEEYQRKHKLSPVEITYYYFKWKSMKKDFRKLRQEFPTCVAPDTRVSTKQGIKKIEDVEPDNIYILKKYKKKPKQTFTLVTHKGYEITCTDDHPIHTPQNGYIQLKDLSPGDRITLEKPGFGTEIQHVTYLDNFVTSTITITPDFARFLGYFMGDGSYSSGKNTISFACDKKSKRVITDITSLMDMFVGGTHGRILGSKKGCVELRKSSKNLLRPFQELGLLRQNSSQSYKRKIHVPEYIFCSPEKTIKQFLIGLFESDGFIDRNGTRIILFSKYKQFMQDVQLLLLGFGITSRLNTVHKKNSKNYLYIGYELILRKNEVLQYIKKIGFVSEKKCERSDFALSKEFLPQYNALPLLFEDKIVEIKKHIIQSVYDITTSTHNFCANGILVHNCPEEAFLSSGDRFFDPDNLNELAKYLKDPIRQEGPWKIYEDPNSAHEYAMGVDPSEGIGGDNAAICIIDFSSKPFPKVVATFKNNHTPPDMLGHEAKIKGFLYNTAYIIPERNNHGHVTINTLRETYPIDKIYMEIKTDTPEDNYTSKLGWNANISTRSRVYSDLNQAVNEKAIIITDKDLMHEFKTFPRNKINQTRTKDDGTLGHWDVLTATALAFHGRDYVQASLTQPKTYILGETNETWYNVSKDDTDRDIQRKIEQQHTPNQSNQSDFNPFEGV